MSEQNRYPTDLAYTGEQALKRFSEVVFKLSETSEKKHFERFFRSVQELKQVARAFELHDQEEFLDAIDDTARKLLERRIKPTEALLKQLKDIGPVLQAWYTSQVSSEVHDKAKELTQSILLKHQMRGFSRPSRQKDETSNEYVDPVEDMLSQGLVTQEQVNEAKRLQRRSIPEILSDMGVMVDKKYLQS